MNVADQLLDPDKYPDRAGERCQLVYHLPTTDRAVDLWKEYATIRAEDKRKGHGLQRATAFYRKHQNAVRRLGPSGAWDERFDARAGEISALQQALQPETIQTADLRCGVSNKTASAPLLT